MPASLAPPPCPHLSFSAGLQQGAGRIAAGPRTVQSVLQKLQQRIEEQRLQALLREQQDAPVDVQVGRQRERLACRATAALCPATAACSSNAQNARPPCPLHTPAHYSWQGRCQAGFMLTRRWIPTLHRPVPVPAGGLPAVRGCPPGAALAAVDGAAGAPGAGVRVPGKLPCLLPRAELQLLTPLCALSSHCRAGQSRPPAKFLHGRIS